MAANREDDHIARSAARHRSTPLIASPLCEEALGGRYRDGKAEGRIHLYEIDDESNQPHFRRSRDARTMELFYDLFFVANLNTFASIREVNDVQALSGYAGFFCVLWFVWLQVTLFDVRFGADSIFERACKALHFGVMIGLAIVGPKFLPSEDTDDSAQANSVHRSFRSLSLILMASQIVLLAQYASVAYFVRRYRGTLAPLSLTMATLGIGAVAFLGVFLGLTEHHSPYLYLAWYAILGFQAILVLAIAGRWKRFSFLDTHLVARLGLLTLIILGEGIIGITKAIKDVVYGSRSVTAATTGQIISSVLILYILYIMYFNRIEADRFGLTRQLLWLLAHLPFHLSLALFFEGVKQFLKWWSCVERMYQIENLITTTGAHVQNGTIPADWVKAVNGTIQGVFQDYRNNSATQDSVSSAAQEHRINEALTAIVKVPNWNATDLNRSFDDLIISIELYIFEQYAFNLPPDLAGLTAEQQADHHAEALAIVFVYCLVTAGASLILLGVLMLLASRWGTRGQQMMVAVRVVVGVALALLTLLTTNNDLMANYFRSPWILPTIMLSLGLVLVFDRLLVFIRPNLFRPPESSPPIQPL